MQKVPTDGNLGQLPFTIVFKSRTAMWVFLSLLVLFGVPGGCILTIAHWGRSSSQANKQVSPEQMLKVVEAVLQTMEPNQPSLATHRATAEATSTQRVLAEARQNAVRDVRALQSSFRNLRTELQSRTSEIQAVTPLCGENEARLWANVQSIIDGKLPGQSELLSAVEKAATGDASIDGKISEIPEATLVSQLSRQVAALEFALTMLDAHRPGAILSMQ